MLPHRHGLQPVARDLRAGGLSRFPGRARGAGRSLASGAAELAGAAPLPVVPVEHEHEALVAAELAGGAAGLREPASEKSTSERTKEVSRPVVVVVVVVVFFMGFRVLSASVSRARGAPFVPMMERLPAGLPVELGPICGFIPTPR